MSDLGFPTIPGTEPAYNVDNLQFDNDPETLRRQYYAQALAQQQQAQQAQQGQQGQQFIPSGAETPGTAVVAPAPAAESIEASADTGYYGDGYGYDDDYGDPGENSDFYDGVQQSSVLVGFALLGQVADQWLKERTGAAGYGPILGAATGNVINTIVAASGSGAKASAKALGGAVLPMVPLAVAVGLKKEISGGTRIALLLSSAGLLAASFYMKRGKK